MKTVQLTKSMAGSVRSRTEKRWFRFLQMQISLKMHYKGKFCKQFMAVNYGSSLKLQFMAVVYGCSLWLQFMAVVYGCSCISCQRCFAREVRNSCKTFSYTPKQFCYACKMFSYTRKLFCFTFLYFFVEPVNWFFTLQNWFVYF